MSWWWWQNNDNDIDNYNDIPFTAWSSLAWERWLAHFQWNLVFYNARWNYNKIMQRVPLKQWLIIYFRKNFTPLLEKIEKTVKVFITFFSLAIKTFFKWIVSHYSKKIRYHDHTKFTNCTTFYSFLDKY